jgi:hypothetical protein
VLLVGAAAAIAAAAEDRPPAAADPPSVPVTALPTGPAAPTPGQPGAGALAADSIALGSDGVAADLTFGGIVLEQRAVGVTVTYPTVSVTAGEDGALAHVRLPTFNCLATDAPAEPLAAGCTPSLQEYADLSSPALTVVRDGAAVRISGRFPTYLRPNGTPPDWTGRVYELALTVAPVDGERPEGRVPAEGEFRLGEDRTRTVGTPGVNVLRYGG